MVLALRFPVETVPKMKGYSDVRAGWHLAAFQDLSARCLHRMIQIPFPISFFEKVSLPSFGSRVVYYRQSVLNVQHNAGLT